MAKTYNIYKIADAFLSPANLAKFTDFVNKHFVKKHVTVLSHPENRCFSSASYWSKDFTIELGSKYFGDNYEYPKPIDAGNLKDVYQNVAHTYCGIFYHEMGHILFTPFGYAISLIPDAPQDVLDFVSRTINILEDPTIENHMINKFPFIKDDILSLRTQYSRTIPNLKESLEAFPEHPDTFQHYLLLKCREYPNLPSYSVWDKYKDYFESRLYFITSEIDAFRRSRMEVNFALNVLKILGGQEPDDNIDGTPNKNGGGVPNPQKGFTPSSNVLSKLIDDGTDCNDSELGRELGQSPSEDSEEAKTATLQTSKGFDSPPVSQEFSKGVIKMLANDEPITHGSHMVKRFSDYKHINSLPESYSKVLTKVRPRISKFVNKVRLLKSRNTDSVVIHKLSGRLNMKDVYNPTEYRIFQKTIKGREEADLAALFLVDNSGSTKHDKAKMAGEALIEVSESLHQLSIPFAIYTFTTCGWDALTVIIKDFKDAFYSVRANLSLFLDQFSVKELHTWDCNVDEINLKYAAQVLKDRPEQDKLLIVLSDGATCGSFSTLKTVVKNIEQDGISVYGIGLYDDNVEDIYTNHYMIHEFEDLQGLGNHLCNFIAKKVFK